MKVALLINEKEYRQKIAGSFRAGEAMLDEYPTADKALDALAKTHYDLLLLHWQVHPGLKSSDPTIKEIAAMIPGVKFNRNVLYWEAALRVIDIMRVEESPNRTTPVVVIFPEISACDYETGEQLPKEQIESDLADRQPARVIPRMPVEQMIETVTEYAG